MPKYLNNKYLFLLLIFFSCSSIYAQDAPMSQFYSNLVILNPAFTGTTKSDRVNLFYRNQWINTSAGFHSFGVAYDKSFPEYNSGVGIILTNEINGAFMAPTFDVTYSYMVELAPQLFVSMGLQGGIAQKYILGSDLVFDSPEPLSGGFSKIVPDFSVGAVAFYNNFYGGFSVDHIAQPIQGYSGGLLNRKYTGFIGYLHYYNTRLKSDQRILSPNLLIQIQGFQQNINWGFSFQYDKLIGGVWVRHNLMANFDAMILSAGYKTKDYKFAYSYDMNLGKKTTIPLGAHEISFTMLFETHKKKKFKSIKCPTFLQ